MITRFAWLIGAMLLLVILCGIPVSVPLGDDFTIPATKQPQSIQPFTPDTMVTQQFPATGSVIQSINLQFGARRVPNGGAVRVSLAAEQGGNWQLLNESRILTQDITDGRTTNLPFTPAVKVIPGQSLRLTVQPDADAATAITWLTNPNYAAEHFALTVNGVPQTGTARFGVTYEPLHGRLFQLIGPVFHRVTVLMNGFWRTVFITAGALFIATLLFVFRQQPQESTVPLAVDSNADEAILDAAESSDAPLHRSGQEGQG